MQLIIKKHLIMSMSEYNIEQVFHSIMIGKIFSVLVFDRIFIVIIL